MTVAGQLNQRIEIQARVNFENARGEKTYTFEKYGEFFAQANPKQGREFIAASQNQGKGPAVFRIRYCNDLDFTMRVIWRGVAYEVTGPPTAVDGGTEWMDIFCNQGVGDARKPG